MFVYLSKKIAIPNGVRLRTVAWNNDQGWIACGGEDGLLKVLKLETGSGTTAANGDSGKNPAPGAAAITAAPGGNRRLAEGLAAPSNLSMNQTLEGHNGVVMISTWNYQYRKLTTSDENGLIIVWILYKGIWYEEMINNRNKSLVADMHWNKDGTKICIAYEDGAVIVGSVDGNRLWGKELAKLQLTHIQWSPDGKYILFGVGNGELQLFDNTGNFIVKVPTFCSEGSGHVKLAALSWYHGLNGYVEAHAPCLAICFDNGKIQIMRDDKDQSPLIVDTNMRYPKMQWNHDGSILAVSGVQIVRSAQGEDKEISLVQFFDPFGQYLRSLKVPGKRITSLSWEHSGLRIALAVDSFIYFANVRPDYKWTFFAGDVLAYAFHRPERGETVVTFWNTKSNEKYTKIMHKLIILTSYGDVCLLVTKPEDSNQYVLTVSNAIGTAIETKYVDFEPRTAVIAKTHVFATSPEVVFSWQFRTLTSSKVAALDALRRKDSRERTFHIDSLTVIGENPSDSNLDLTNPKNRRFTTDPIVCIAASDSTFIVARQSGVINHHSLPSLTLESKYTVPFRAAIIALNCNSTRMAITDVSGVLKLFDLDVHGSASLVVAGAMAGSGISKKKDDFGKLVDFERKDVWDIKWANDDPELFAIMEKTRMYILRALNPEEPITCSGYICNFTNLQIKAVLLDEVMREPEAPSKELLVTMETKSLRDTRNILTQVGLPDALQFVEDNPHPRLWRLVAEAALGQLEFEVAQKAFVRCADYIGLQVVKRLQKLDDKLKQKAEVYAYLGQIEQAERMYLEADRKDLAIDLRMRLGDWFRVVQLIKSGGGGDDALLENAWSSIGDFYYERQKWSQAVTYYAQGRNMDRLVELYYNLEDYDNLERLMESIMNNPHLLKDVAGKFVSVGMCDQAVKAYAACGEMKEAIEACVHLNQWNMAVELAQKHKIREIGDLLSQYAKQLLERDKVFVAIELYRKANFCQQSAKLLYELTKSAATTSDPVRTKKLYVLAALEVERYHALTKAGKGGSEKATAALDALLTEDRTNPLDSKILDTAWRGAEAYHFYLLAQKQYYHGDFDDAVRTAQHLVDYEDILSPEVIYSLIALVSFHAKRFGVCSRAFIKLEAMPGIPPEKLDQFEAMSLSIFTR
ncbi:WD repeat-containing protein 35 [Rhizophlyctis rosea]|uniref:WD repeat-containing protein 35 n=1 Tax=Rhizophlyctis rosea TaxID=64517 RepID=A0AAD5X6J4_9FUNG|nr:WD repeat-containing protein 35 [Rhizophlyctis rosea]